MLVYIIFGSSKPLADMDCVVKVKEFVPGPEFKTDEDMKKHVKDTLGTTFRTLRKFLQG